WPVVRCDRRPEAGGDQPGRRVDDRRGGLRRPGRRRAGHRRRGEGDAGLAGPVGLRPGGGPQEGRRPDAGAGRPPGPAVVPRAKDEILHSADTFEWFAEEGKRAYGRIIPPANVAKRHHAIKHPVGVVGSITPWNFPVTLPSRKIAPALAVGCTVVSRPAEQTPLCLIALFECLEEAGVPPGVANLVMGKPREVADAYFARPEARKISFTGSTEVGKELIRRSADHVKRLSLELGGHAPLIVFPDADVQQVAQAAVIGKFRNNGQVCIAPSRFYVHEKLSKDFTEAAVELSK